MSIYAVLGLALGVTVLVGAVYLAARAGARAAAGPRKFGFLANAAEGSSCVLGTVE